MTPLSPAAQAVLDAMHRSYDHEPNGYGDGYGTVSPNRGRMVERHG